MRLFVFISTYLQNFISSKQSTDAIAGNTVDNNRSQSVDAVNVIRHLESNWAFSSNGNRS